MLSGLLEDESSALHFSGHGAGKKGLCFQADDGDDGSTVSVTAPMFNEVMRAADGRLKLVVLNACYSEVQARAIIAHVPCVIGAPHAITDGCGSFATVTSLVILEAWNAQRTVTVHAATAAGRPVRSWSGRSDGVGVP